MPATMWWRYGRDGGPVGSIVGDVQLVPEIVRIPDDSPGWHTDAEVDDKGEGRSWVLIYVSKPRAK